MEMAKCNGLLRSLTLELGEPAICPYRSHCMRFMMPMLPDGQRWIEAQYCDGKCVDYVPIELEVARLTTLQ